MKKIFKWRTYWSSWSNVYFMNLQVIENKRKLIYKNGKLIGTQPFIINSNKEI